MLKVLATTAPHWIEKKGNNDSLSLNSSEPYSLYNAVRYAMHMAQKKVGIWGESNWNNPNGSKKGIMYYEFYENQKEEYINLLNEIKPNLLLIGTMTLGFAGAIELAKIAKSLFGNNIFIVVGGKHIIETTYLTNGQISINDNCCLRLMQSGRIPKVFDMVLSGDGEEVIYEVGNIIGMTDTENVCKSFFSEISNLKLARGNWLMGWLNHVNHIEWLQSVGNEIVQDNMPSLISVFGVKSNFQIFQSEITAHTYSYMSKGCIFNCYYCSERNEINGKLTQKETAPERLYQQFVEVYNFGKLNGLNKVSAFVEDSILLAGNVKLLDKLNKLLKKSHIQIEFGGQLTTDLVLNLSIQQSITELAKSGLSYLFIGIETNNTHVSSQLSKNTNKDADWVIKNEKVLLFLKSIGIKCGVSLLFGLGEEHYERISLLNQIKEWQHRIGMPQVISLNYATQHPLKDPSFVTHDYVDWGTSSESPLLPIFIELFGEASEKYIIAENKLGTLNEFQEIQNLYRQLNLTLQ